MITCRRQQPLVVAGLWAAAEQMVSMFYAQYPIIHSYEEEWSVGCGVREPYNMGVDPLFQLGQFIENIWGSL